MRDPAMLYCAALLGDRPEILLAGDAEALQRLADAIRSGEDVDCTGTQRAGAYPVRLTHIRVERTDGERIVVRGTEEDRSLELRGPHAMLEVLAQVIEDLAVEGRAGEHVHIEYAPDHYYLAPESMPLVVQCDAEVRRRI